MRLLIPVLLSLTCLQAGAETTTLVRAVEIVGYGIYTAREKVRVQPSTADAPGADGVKGVTFTEYTTEIPAVLGTSFGIQYLINSSPKGGGMKVTCVILFPDAGLVDPRGRIYKKSTETITSRIGRKSLYGYGFDEPWELVPGEWVFQIWHKGARLAQKKFTVLPPGPVAETS